MSAFPQDVLPHSPLISWHSEESGIGYLPLLFNTQTTFSNAWNTANTAYFVPIAIRYPITITSLWIANGAVVSGNFDVGLYTPDGRRIVSTGSTVQTGINTIQNIPITAITIGAGQYYIGTAMDNTTGRLFSFNPTSSVWAANCGSYKQATAFPLPASATFATMVGSNPYFALSGLARVPTV